MLMTRETETSSNYTNILSITQTRQQLKKQHYSFKAKYQGAKHLNTHTPISMHLGFLEPRVNSLKKNWQGKKAQKS